MSGSMRALPLNTHTPPSAGSLPCDQAPVSTRDACCLPLSSSFFTGTNPLLQSSASSAPACTATPSTKLRTISAATNNSSNSSSTPSKYEVYEVELEKPIGLKFYKGQDGGVYIDAIAPGGNADKTKQITPGDKVLFTSAVFGTEMWPAAAYGQTMYTIRQRIGTLLLKMERRFGEREDAAVSRDVLAAERNAGAIGERIREIQIQNYMRKVELQKQREEDLDAGLKLYRAGQYKEALEKFDSVLGAKPEYKEEAVANYNIACCYSKLNEVEAGLSALEAAMEAGFEDYKTVRSDPDLANLRVSPKFTPLIDKYDEPFINENAVKALKSVFGLFGGKK
ncbi:hypothetical protein GOP47_0020726 [Adiantum capillus-veneris]|uniref:PDZ domain-containing protein n=1 Tax=Adiantum capillus-veneris TaxID=13818 RepID=A0A9D4U9P3_ADICA|nr:hypothetical protein GOP47_0020726 [Adiantum capillus-veneris]